MLDAPFGRRRRWTESSQTKGNERSAAPLTDISVGTKGETLDLFFLSLSHTPEQRRLRNGAVLLCRMCPTLVLFCSGLLVSVKTKNRRTSSSVGCYNSPGPCGMCKEVTKSLTDSCTFAHLLSLPVLSIHRLLFFCQYDAAFSDFGASSKDFTDILFWRYF